LIALPRLYPRHRTLFAGVNWLALSGQFQLHPGLSLLAHRVISLRRKIWSLSDDTVEKGLALIGEQ